LRGGAFAQAYRIDLSAIKPSLSQNNTEIGIWQSETGARNSINFRRWDAICVRRAQLGQAIRALLVLRFDTLKRDLIDRVR
jgi:hypothetical protein